MSCPVGGQRPPATVAVGEGRDRTTEGVLQPHPLDGHAPVHGLAHVVDGEQGHLHGGEGLLKQRIGFLQGFGLFIHAAADDSTRGTAHRSSDDCASRRGSGGLSDDPAQHSPGGTTERAVQQFESDDLRGRVAAAMRAACERSIEMARDMG